VAHLVVIRVDFAARMHGSVDLPPSVPRLTPGPRAKISPWNSRWHPGWPGSLESRWS
jgi:hypothetical protein